MGPTPRRSNFHVLATLWALFAIALNASLVFGQQHPDGVKWTVPSHICEKGSSYWRADDVLPPIRLYLYRTTGNERNVSSEDATVLWSIRAHYANSLILPPDIEGIKAGEKVMMFLVSFSGSDQVSTSELVEVRAGSCDVGLPDESSSAPPSVVAPTSPTSAPASEPPASSSEAPPTSSEAPPTSSEAPASSSQAPPPSSQAPEPPATSEAPQETSNKPQPEQPSSSSEAAPPASSSAASSPLLAQPNVTLLEAASAAKPTASFTALVPISTTSASPNFTGNAADDIASSVPAGNEDDDSVANANSENGRKSLSGGAIAGIVIGILALIIAVLVVVLLLRRRRRHEGRARNDADNSGFVYYDQPDESPNPSSSDHVPGSSYDVGGGQYDGTKYVYNGPEEDNPFADEKQALAAAAAREDAKPSANQEVDMGRIRPIRPPRYD